MATRLVIIGPGLMPIPPTGWGAIEILIWEYKCVLEKNHGWEVIIVNTPDSDEIVRQTNAAKPDIVHIHYDAYHWLYDKFDCKNVVLTAHFPYICNPTQMSACGYMGNFTGFIKATHDGAVIHALSHDIANMYIRHGAKVENVFVLQNGANQYNIRFTENPVKNSKTICLGSIQKRKGQYLIKDIPGIEFVGKDEQGLFHTGSESHVGEWSKEEVAKNLTEYGNLVLMSEGEAHALVCCEALMAGLGLVISEHATANIDCSQPFITVIPGDKMQNKDFVAQEIEKNRIVSLKLRREIRNYAEKTFSWIPIVEKYVTIVSQYFRRNQVGAYYQCHRQLEAATNVISSFRKAYPSSSIVMVCDGGDNKHKDIADAHHAIYYYEEENLGYPGNKETPESIMKWFVRFFKYIHHITDPWFMLLEDDVYIVRATDTSKLMHDLNGINPHVRLPITACDYLRTIHPQLPHGGLVYGGMGGAIFRTAFFKDLADNIDNVMKEIARFCEMCPPSSGTNWYFTDVILTYLTYLYGGAVGQNPEFIETWYHDAESRMRDGTVAIIHQYKYLYK